MAANDSAVAFRDAFPVSRGHTLVVPRVHAALLSELSKEQSRDLFDLVYDLCAGELYAPPARTIGVNDGPLAGQTVAHVHVHLIPRRLGDVADPRGGVRWVLPEQADYWSARP